MTTNHLSNHIISIDALVPGGGTVTDITISSPNATVDVTNGEITTSGTVEIDVNGKPPTDDTTELGSSAARWSNLHFGLAHGVLWDNGSNDNNAHKYTDAIGPWWHDRTTGFNLNFNVQSLSASRTATWQNSNGTVAWLTDIPSISSPTGTIDVETSGADFTVDIASSSPSPSAPISGVTQTFFVNGPFTTGIIAPATTLAAQTVVLHDGTQGGQIFCLVSTHIITALTLSGTFNHEGLTDPTTLTANSTTMWQWDAADAGGTLGWARIL